MVFVEESMDWLGSLGKDYKVFFDTVVGRVDIVVVFFDIDSDTVDNLVVGTVDIVDIVVVGIVFDNCDVVVFVVGMFVVDIQVVVFGFVVDR